MTVESLKCNEHGVREWMDDRKKDKGPPFMCMDSFDLLGLGLMIG